MSHWRVVVHALDRTGPPMLARSVLRWSTRHRPEDSFDVIALRGGPLLADFAALAPTRVLLDPQEPWSPDHDRDSRLDQLRTRMSKLRTADATLVVSVSAGDALAVLPDSGSPVLTWVVEHEEDIDEGLREATTTWLAGSDGTRENLWERLGADTEVHVVREFVDEPAHVDPEVVANCRVALGAEGDELIVVGAGIATTRKGPDLFLEVALAHERVGGAPALFAWIGGEHDPMHHLLVAEAARCLGDRVRFHDSVPDVTPWFAAADVFLHTARVDAFPLVCLHAAAAGTPVVSFSGTGGVTEMFDDSFHGAPFPDVSALARSLAQLSDPSLRSLLGRRQQEVVRGRFTAEVAAPEVHRALLRATGGATS